jgi:hypothetical protein
MFMPHRHLAIAAAVLGLSVAVPCARADTVGLHLASHHFPSKHYNNSNPGIYYRVDEGWTAGYYRNSLRKDSVYAGYTWKYHQLDITTALVTGYFHDVQPLLVPSLSLFTYEGFTPRVAYIPRVEKKIGSHVLHLMVERAF